ATGPITGIATFSDPAGQGKENAGDFTATIIWGDGTSGPGTVVMLGGGNYQVNAPSHTYAEDGTFTSQGQAAHDGTAPAASDSKSDPIGEARISKPVVVSIGASEGTATGAITGIAAFTDSAGVASAGDVFTAAINWGDGSANDVGTVVSVG